MKRPKPKKLRDRRSGMSSYARHGKVPYRYSTAYREWFRSVHASHKDPHSDD